MNQCLICLSKPVRAVAGALPAALMLAGCNGDVFIKPITATPDRAEVSATHPAVRIHVSGKDWTVEDICFAGSGAYTEFGGLHDSDIRHVESPFVDMYVRAGSDYIDVEYVDYAGSEPGTLSFSVTDDYQYIPVEITVMPNAEQTIEIEEVTYTLDTWGGYPDQNYTANLITYVYPKGLPEPTMFTFPAPETVPVQYFFEPDGEAGLFVNRVLNSGIAVPVPSYTRNLSWEDDFWAMTGEEAPLTTKISKTSTAVVPPVPAPVELPADMPLDVTLTCDYESVELYCRIKAKNAAGTSATVRCTLRMLVPVKFNALVEKR